MLEHLVPRGLLVTDLVEQSEALTAPELVGLLRSRLVAAVVTRTEDRALAGAGVAKDFPVHGNPSDDLWSRYRMAGLDVMEFRPLTPT